MNIERTWLWAAGGLVLGLLLGIAIAGDGHEARAIAERSQREIAADVASVSEAVGRIDQSLTELGGRVSGIETAVSQVTEQQAGGVEDLARRLEEVGAGLDGAVAELGGAMSDVGSSVTASLTERLEGLRAALGGIGARAGGSGASESAAAAAGPGAGEAVAIGHTVGFGDGAARLFLSGINRAAGTARVAINGPTATSVSLGQPVEAGACTLTLTGFTDDGATFEGDCGGGASAAATPESAPAAASGAGTAVAVGSAATLADDRLRVFLSGIDAEAGTARVAVNGPQTMALTVGQPAEAGGCTVTLTGIGDGQATIDAQC